MSTPKRLLIAIVPLLVIWIGACVIMVGRIEADLTARAFAAVEQSGSMLDRPAVAIEGRDATLSGLAFDPQGERPAIDAADHTFGMRLVANEITPVPTVKPYLFEAKRDRNALVLTGSVPRPAVRASLVDAAKAAVHGIRVVDRLAYASGAPEHFAEIASHGLVQLGMLADSSFLLSDKAYSISGTAPDSAVYEAAMAETRQLPGGATFAAAAILAPEAKPYIMSASSDGRSLELTGSVPTIAVRQAIVAKAADAMPGIMIVNHLGIARGAPQGDFGAAAYFALTELGKLSRGIASLIDGHCSIAGVGKEQVSAETIAADASAGLPPGFDLAANGVVAPVVSPFTFSVLKTREGIALSGYTPSVAERDAVMSAARAAAGSGTVSGTLKLASGAPSGVDFKGGAGLALSELGRLLQGSASLDDGKLTVTGDAADPETAVAVRAALNGVLPAGVTRGDIDIREPIVSPYVLRATKHDDKVTLTGFYPDARSHNDILAAARLWFNDTALVDELTLGRGAPADFVAAATAALDQLSRLGNGEAKVSDSKVSIFGDARYAKAVADIEADLSAGMPKGYTASATLQVAPPAAPVDAASCQALLAAILESKKITFDTASASIEKYARPVLDALVATAMRCPDAHLEISGHTDDSGNDEMNRELSRRRAEAVAAYLVNAGIDAARLNAEGYGDARPIAPNDSEEGRARNRRIEFQLK